MTATAERAGYGSDYDKSLTRGAMQDDTQDDLLMSNNEMRTAIEKSGVHLKALIFDCCIMNNMESITEFLDLTDYYYGSGHSTIASDHKVLVETEFDQKVQWSRLFKLNPYFPKNNPPTDDEGDHLRGTSLIHF